jgi:hypothetical protein
MGQYDFNWHWINDKDYYTNDKVDICNNAYLFIWTYCFFVNIYKHLSKRMFQIWNKIFKNVSF